MALVCGEGATIRPGMGEAIYNAALKVNGLFPPRFFDRTGDLLSDPKFVLNEMSFSHLFTPLLNRGETGAIKWMTKVLELNRGKISNLMTEAMEEFKDLVWAKH